ncbi:MAG: CpaF family protein [Armatimonadia bacterium]
MAIPRADYPQTGGAKPSEGGPAAHLAEAKVKVHQKLLRETEFTVLQHMSQTQLLERIQYLTDIVSDEMGVSFSAKTREQLQNEVLNEVTGYGPIQPFLDDPTVSEVMVNGPKMVYVEREGRLQRTDKTFMDNGHVMRIIEKVIAPLGRRLDESSPMVDARLPDGSRVNAIIPPLALLGPCVTIRKFSADPFTADDLVSFGTMTEKMKIFLEACVKARLNILVAGGTGSGKTTTLNVLSSFIPETERIITVEDAAELQMQQPHVLTLESRPANIEGKGEVTIRNLVRNCLRMRPDRIIVGECRGGEALDMLQAMNTGHDGSLSTLHSNSPRDTLSRLETMVLMAGTELPVRAIREQITSAINLIVQQTRLRDGTRRISYVTEVQRMEGDGIVLEDIFRLERQGIGPDGRIIANNRPTGVRPLFMETLAAEGQDLPADIFTPTN